MVLFYIYIISNFLGKVKLALFTQFFPIGDFSPETAVSGDKKVKGAFASFTYKHQINYLFRVSLYNPQSLE